MLVGNVLEKVNAEAVWELCANKLADAIRDIWLKNTGEHVSKWNSAFSEDSAALQGLRDEGFLDLVGLDYIFKWWGASDSEQLAGELDVIWKLLKNDGSGAAVTCYRTWIRLAKRDFLLGLYPDETAKREVSRMALRDAFQQWNKLFQKI